MAVRWDNGDYYGKKNKIYFKKLNTMIMHIFEQAGDGQVNQETLDNLLNLIGRQQNLTHTVTKLVNTLSINTRMVNIEKMLDCIPIDVIAQARQDYAEKQELR